MDKADSYINYMIDMEATGQNIRNFMKITGYSARELERLIGCTQMTFFNWQEGKNLPSFDNLLRLAGILKTPIEKIVVFKKFEIQELPLKESNSGFIRNNVFFTYNSATECVIRDCMVFKKKYGLYPDQMLLNLDTLKNWQSCENINEEASPLELDYITEAIQGSLIQANDETILKTPFFSVQLILSSDIPLHYYRLLKKDSCNI